MYINNDHGYSYNDELIAASINQVNFVALSLTTFLKGVEEMKEKLEEIASNGTPPGAQFIFLYYLGKIDEPFFVNKTKDGEILQKLFNNGNNTDYKKWLSTFVKLKSDLLNHDLSGKKEYHVQQPLTLKNIQKVCQMIIDLKIEKEISEPFVLLEKLEALQK